ncbi:MAG: alanine dehydrogenase [Proteobacteria bacterium]|nr:alanine dehydrogenase [Pseudomonadota bacterium]
MVIGVPREIKKQEYRVSITPSGVYSLVSEGNKVFVEKGAGLGSGFKDSDYENAGAVIMDKEKLFQEAELIIKVKEPLPEEYGYFRENTALFTFLHLASNFDLVEFLCKKRITSFAYETLEVNNTLPLLSPMSEIAGKMAPLVGSFYLQKRYKGAGLLPMGVTGIGSAKVLIIGAGNVGFNSARVSYNLGLETVVLNRGIERLQKIDEYFNGRVKTKILDNYNLEEELYSSDIIIGAILVPGGRTPILINRKMLKKMKRGAVIVDVSIDQGGCVETAKPTTHDRPIYIVEGVIHYMVANMPGAYPRTSTIALTNATLPYVKLIAKLGIDKAIKDKVLLSALNIYNGKITNDNLAKTFNIRC